MAYLTRKQIIALGFRNVGNNILISDKASFYNCRNISLADNIRIDDFVVVSAGKGGIQIGSFVHIAIYTSLVGTGKIVIEDFANISSRVAIYSSTDDFSGESMTNPLVLDKFKNVHSADIYIGKHAIIGTGSVILPGVIIEEGAAIGALSLVKDTCKSFFIYAGIPAKKIKRRSKKLLKKSTEFLKQHENHT